jgi:hypothetical protein
MRPQTDIPFGFCQCGCGGKTRIADRTRPKQGYVKGQPYPFITNHAKSKGRLDRYVIEGRGYDTPCWIWQGTIDKAKGYGSIKIDGKMLKVHRVMYEREVGPIPEGMELDHRCKVRACMNPAHLEPVTGIVNIRRGRHVKLSDSDRAEIAAFCHDLTPKDVVVRFGLNRSHAWRVLRDARLSK